MTRSQSPILVCDGDDGDCDEWEHDYYEQTASTVNGFRITPTERAPRWKSTRFSDYCPKHADDAGAR